MRLFLAALMLIAATSPIFAQTVPEEARRDLWCGLAFSVLTGDAPADAPAARQATSNDYAAGAEMLVGRATVAHLAAGYSDSALEGYVAALRIEVEAQLAATDGAAPYSFEDCSALLGF